MVVSTVDDGTLDRVDADRDAERLGEFEEMAVFCGRELINVAGNNWLLLLFRGKLSCKILAAGEVESPWGLFSEIALIGPLRIFKVEAAIELAPLMVAVEVALCCCCTCVEFITAETANLALAVSRVKRDVGCEEKECSNVGYELSRSQV